jgi:hypothetical protein
MHRIALFFVLALAACGGGMQRPGVDLEPESLILEVDADTPIRDRVRAWLPLRGGRLRGGDGDNRG